MVWLNMEIKICNTAVWGDKIIIVKNTNSLILLSGKEGKSSEKKNAKIWICPLFEEFLCCKFVLAIILQNETQYLKIFVIGNVLNFILFVSLVACFYGLAKGSFGGQTMRIYHCYYYYYYHHHYLLLTFPCDRWIKY